MPIPFLLALSLPAHALEVPLGWTLIDPARAVLRPGDPGAGELRELQVSGGSCDPDELGMVLQVTGLAAQTLQLNQAGSVDLAIGDRMGRARCRAEAGMARWVMILADPAQAAALDPDALLQAALPSDHAMDWSDAPAHDRPVQVLPPGADGNPWGAQATATEQGWWRDAPTDAWQVDPAVVGTWQGTALLSATPTRLVFRFESGGTVYLERTSRGRTESHEGVWAARKGRLRMDIPGGGEDLVYDVLGSTLKLEYAHADTTLHKK